ncbi:MAG: DNA mismatch repair endonuclease MutL [Eubacteriales bacterium]|nr:DNA mismatch repair endonuclease MutL [Eubacteriales bacterium]MDD4422032.1 DNA mismatch repair endonuclease MutL [Eubacteriales bacterium]
MGIINILDTQTANMIAAGEVVDRPASALKELIENSIDAGATSVNIEIRGGGIAFMRVSDNGVGFARDDIPKALLRHATSKIKTGRDLDGIGTLGFRGEALAAISSVSRIEIISKRREDELGTRLTGDENGIVMTDTGCPSGTTVIVKNLFYNVPARYKFLKRDSSEAAAAAAVAERIALSHPEVSISFTSEGEKKFYTGGDGSLISSIYSVYGRDFANGLKEIDFELEGVRVSGYVSAPANARGSRALQNFFVNGRFVRSKTVMAALEEAYKAYIPHGKYPAGIININLNAKNIDVNVHPAKLEIKFADERKIFEAVYYGVKNMLTEREDIIFQPQKAAPGDSFTSMPPEQTEPAELTSTCIPEKEKSDGNAQNYGVFKPDLGEEDMPLIDLSTNSIMTLNSPIISDEKEKLLESANRIGQSKDIPSEQLRFTDEKQYNIIGEAYNAYIFVELDDKILIIDKHAAHERVLYEELANKKEIISQQLMNGITITLPHEQAEILSSNLAYLEEYGFIAEPFGYNTLIIRAVPTVLADMGEIAGIFESFAEKLTENNTLPFTERVDRALFTVACKAAMKAGQKNDPAHNEWLVNKIMTRGDIRVCPHGRPVIKEISKHQLEKFFDR